MAPRPLFATVRESAAVLWAAARRGIVACRCRVRVRRPPPSQPSSRVRRRWRCAWSATVTIAATRGRPKAGSPRSRSSCAVPRPCSRRRRRWSCRCVRPRIACRQMLLGARGRVERAAAPRAACAACGAGPAATSGSSPCPERSSPLRTRGRGRPCLSSFQDASCMGRGGWSEREHVLSRGPGWWPGRAAGRPPAKPRRRLQSGDGSPQPLRPATRAGRRGAGRSRRAGRARVMSRGVPDSMCRCACTSWRGSRWPSGRC